jgi:YidC/Oxa1 family membrane protein insertase
MPDFFGVPVDAAYHVVSAFAGFLTPLFGGLAAAAAIVLFTVAVRLLLVPFSYRAMRGMDAQARMAPQVAALRKKHAKQPERMQRELTALYQAEGTSMFAGCLPLLLQWPFLSVMYLLFRSQTIAGAPNTLLTHDLLGAPLGSHLLGGAGLVSTQGAVFAGLLVLLAVVGWLSARLARRFAAPSGGTVAPAQPATAHGGQGRGRQGRGKQGAGGQAGTAAVPAGASAAVARLAPYVTVAIAAFVPLAAGLYLVTTTTWTLAERLLLRRRLGPPPALPVVASPAAAKGR